MFDKLKQRIVNALGYSTEASGAKRDPKKVAVKRLGSPIKGSGGGDFEEQPVDFNIVTMAYNTDSYVKRAIDKYSELMLKAGWEVSAKDEAISDYLWLRLKLIEEGTSQSIDNLLKEICEDIVMYGNAFVVKSRQSGSSSVSGVKAVGYSSTKPINGYFVLPPWTIKISRDEKGKITAYQQDAGTGSTIDFKPEDIIHFAYKRPRGRAFGVPYVWPALNDVKMLRQVEDNVSRLIYRNLFPLYQYKVGLDKPGFEATPEEIEELRDEIRSVPMDGALVVPERHNITVVSSNSAVMNVEPYMKIYRQRVFSGLGVSDVVMGIGGVSTGTADNLTAEMIDGTKEFQSVLRNTVQREIINELLFEGGYDPVANKEHEAVFNLLEIELDAKIKKENHLVQLFTQNAITHEELRAGMGQDPVSDEGRLYFNMVTAALSAQAAQDAASAANSAGTNKDQPTNQSGTQGSPGKPKRSKAAPKASKENKAEILENVLTDTVQMVNLQTELKIIDTHNDLLRMWSAFRDDVMRMAKTGESESRIEGFVIQLVKQNLRSKIEKSVTQSFHYGLNQGVRELKSSTPLGQAYFEAEKLKKYTASFVDRLVNEMKTQIFKALNEESPTEKLSKLMGVFNSNTYRLQFITNTELYRAYNFGIAIAAKYSDKEFVYTKHEGNCEACLEKSGHPITLNQPDLMDAIPPHHTNCTCTVYVNPSEEEV
jgi:glycerophosphoryl diester phosphodiesterase